MTARRLDGATLAAFASAIVIGGSNFVAVRYLNAEIPPFASAGVRFSIASLLFFLAMRVARIPFPYGAALAGALVYGVLNFAMGYAFAYTGLQQVPAGTASVIVATVPLLTTVLAVAHRIERPDPRPFIGALIGFAGIAVIFVEQLSANVPPFYLLAMAGSALTAAEATVLVKRFPRTHPISTNAIAMLVGGLALVGLSAITGEHATVPHLAVTWWIFAYIATLGTAGLFVPLLYVINRWTASAASYALLAAPLVAISLGAALRGEAVTPFFLIGAVIVAAGVYIGAIRQSAGA